MRPKDIGTVVESAVVAFLRDNGFPHAERRALRGNADCGDIVGIAGVCIEVKGGHAAETASDNQILAWLAETEKERVNARADIGILVVKRKAIGARNAGQWWAVMPLWQLTYLLADDRGGDGDSTPVRLHLADACALLRAAGYGTAAS